jgi:hypothetical protein
MRQSQATVYRYPIAGQSAPIPRPATVPAHSMWEVKPVVFAIVAVVMMFLYFEVEWQIWFLRMLGGYLVKVWILPLGLLVWVLVDREKLDLDVGVFLLSSLGLYSFFALLSLCANETMYFALKWYLIMIAPLWAFVVIVTKFRSNVDIRYFLRVVLICGTAQAAYSTYSFNAWAQSGELQRSDVVTSQGTIMGGGEGPMYQMKGENATPRFGDVSFEVGKLAAMLFPLAVLGVCYPVNKRFYFRVLGLGLTLAILYLTVATTSRAAVLAAIVAMSSLLYYQARMGFVKKRILLFVAPAVLYVLISNLPTWLRVLQGLTFFDLDARIPIVGDLIANYGVSRWDDAHLTSIAESLEYLSRDYLLGAGYSEVLYSNSLYGSEHNRVLFILASTGLLTAIPYVAFVAGILVQNWRCMWQAYRNNRQEARLGLVLFACNLMFILKLVGEGMETFYYWIFFALTAAWVRNCRRDWRLQHVPLTPSESRRQARVGWRRNR